MMKRLSETAGVLAKAAEAVTETMLRRGYNLDCILGSRLLSDFLTELHFDAEVVGTALLILDPVATTTQMEQGAVLQVGGHDGIGTGFNGHVVVCARTSDGDFLLDPTIGQLADHPQTAALGGKLHVLVTRLRERWPTATRSDVNLPVEGWTLAYRHDPELDWTQQNGWRHLHLDALASEVRAVYARGPEIASLMGKKRPLVRFRVGRNDPCPCGSGKKYKRCHAAAEVATTYTGEQAERG